MNDEEQGRQGALCAGGSSELSLIRLSSIDPLSIREQGCGCTPATADQIVEAARQIVERRMARGAPFSDPAVSRGYFRDRLGGLEREVFAAAFLDTRHRLIEVAELFQGTVDGAEVHPREVVKQALLHNAAAVIVAHNHPSGEVEPSSADRAVTARLKQALALVDVRLLDHVIVGGTRTLALAERGWL